MPGVDVFISYKRDEREVVALIAERLQALSLEVWYDDKLKASETFDQQIADKLAEAKAVLVCWTTAAWASNWVRGEAFQALQEEKLVGCFLAPTTLEIPFNLTQVEDLTRWGGQELDRAWVKILERIGELVDRPGLATFDWVMQPTMSIHELRAWGQAHGADPLAEQVWERVALLDDEDQDRRIEREQKSGVTI